MEKVTIDSNYNYLGPQFPTIPPEEVARLNLKDGEAIIAEQEGEAWKGIVEYDDSLPENMKWYVVLGERIDNR